MTVQLCDYEFYGSQNDDYEDYCLVGYDAVLCGRNLILYPRDFLIPSSGVKIYSSTFISMSYRPDWISMEKNFPGTYTDGSYVFGIVMKN
jgi:hypothetical protein